MTWIVYTLFDRHGNLLYAGMTTDLPRRLYEHGQSKPWFSDVVKCLQVQHATAQSARDAECSIIAGGDCLYNRNITDFCPRCRAQLRANNGRAPYCIDCQRVYNRGRKIRQGWKPRPAATLICPKCGGPKPAGPAYCRPCKNAYDDAWRKR